MIRRQLPSYSPLSLRLIAGAAASAVARPEEAREALRRLLASRYHCESVNLTGSGTEALELALRVASFCIREPRPVALPAYSCFDMATAAVGADLRVLLYDLDPGTLSPDLSSLQRCLDAGAGTVVAANLFGFPLDWAEVEDRCRSAGAILIEDAAQGLGSFWQGRGGGSFGGMTVLSFGRGKGWTGGGGGALLVRRPDLKVAEVLKTRPGPLQRGGGFRAASLALAQWAFGRPNLFGIPSAVPGLGLGQTVYREPKPPGWMAGFSASLVTKTAALAAEEVGHRKRAAQRYTEMLENMGPQTHIRLVSSVKGGESSYLRFPLFLPTEMRGMVDGGQMKSRGVVSGYPLGLHELARLFPLLDEPGRAYSGAEELRRDLVTLPTHSRVSDSDLRFLARAFSTQLPSSS